MLLTCSSGIFFITFNLLSSLITEAVVTTTIRSATLLFMLIYTERNLVRAISGRETRGCGRWELCGGILTINNFDDKE